MADEQDGMSSKSENVEEGQEEQDTILTSTGAWLNDWWQSAKEKSSSALEFMKRDLTEFSQVVQNDTASVVSNTTAILKDKLRVDDSTSVAGRAKQGFNDLLHTVSGALYPTREPDNHELVVIRDSEAIVLDKWQAELYRIQSDLSTFSHEPQGPPELYEKWLEGFSLEDKQPEISSLLQHCPEVQSSYSKLVSSSVSEAEFWQRYFYRVWQLKESKRADLVRRAQPKSMAEELPWDEDDDDDRIKCTKPIIPADSEMERILVNDQSQEIECTNVPTTAKTTSESDNRNVSPPSSDSSEKGTSDEWEKDFDLELNDSTFSTTNADDIVKVKLQDEEEWESWE